MNEACQKAVWRFGKEGIIPVAEEDGVYNFYLKEKIPDQDAVSPHSPEGPPPSMSRPSSSSGTMTTTPPLTRTTAEVRAIPRRSEAPPEPAGVPRRERTRSPRFACALEEEVDVPAGGEELVVSEGVEARPANPGGVRRHQHQRRRKSMKLLAMRCTEAGALNAWRQRAMGNNIVEYLIRGSCSTQWSWTIGT